MARIPGRNYPKEDVCDLVEAVRDTLEQALCTSPIAGPEELFRHEVLALGEKVFEAPEALVAVEFGELARAYADKIGEEPSERFPLPHGDRVLLKSWYEHYVELSEHPLLLGKETPEEIQIFLQLSHGKAAPRKPGEDLSADDVRRSHQKIRQRLRHFTWKHFVLLRVTQLCDVYQRKWKLAGPLAACDAASLRQVLRNLVGRHLVLREGDGSYSVHPAVRDYFGRLAPAAEQEEWHDILREQMMSLIQKPGVRLPEDATSLNLGEEAIHHALAAGREDWALWLYKEVLGGLRHLGWKLGEMTRGLRILRQFATCPDPWAEAWFLRALGELEPAHALNGLPTFRADIRLLQGRLPEVAAAGDAQRAAVAEFLMGKSPRLPPDPLGCVVPREHILLYVNRPFGNATALPRAFYDDAGWRADLARKQLFWAEFASQRGDHQSCRKFLEQASNWILHSGSVEHLCLLHLIQARVLKTTRDLPASLRAVAEGVQLARQCGLALYLVELLTEKAEILLAQGEADAAESSARDALDLASAQQVQFLWGAALAGHVLGQALVQQGKMDAARKALHDVLTLRKRIGDPRTWQTEKLLNGLADTAGPGAEESP